MRKLICGKNAVRDALKNGIKIKKIYTSKENQFSHIERVEIKIVSNSFLNQLTSENHQGYVAEIESFNYHNFSEIISKKPAKILILDHLQDSHNLGAIMRSAGAFGFKYLILPKKRSVKMNITVSKIASGAYGKVAIVRVDSLVDAIVKLKKAGYWIYASSLAGGRNPQEVIKNYPLALIVGNEAKGVSRTLVNQSDQIIKIPMDKSIESLNVSVAAAILMFCL